MPMLLTLNRCASGFQNLVGTTVYQGPQGTRLARIESSVHCGNLACQKLGLRAREREPEKKGATNSAPYIVLYITTLVVIYTSHFRTYL